MTSPDVDQLTVTERTAHAASHPRSYTTSDTDVTGALSLTVSHRNASMTARSTTVSTADRQRPAGTASAAVNWSAWQAPVDSYELLDTVADYDNTAYDYDYDDDALNGERMKTTTERQQFENNASGTEGPAVNASRTEGLPVNASGSEGPPVNASGTEGPVLNASGTGGPAVNASRTEGPAVNASRAEGLPVNASGSEGPPVNASGTEGPAVNASGTECPAVNDSGIEGPPVNASGTEGPAVNASGAEGLPVNASWTQGPPVCPVYCIIQRCRYKRVYIHSLFNIA